MNRFLVIVLTGVVVALATASPAQAHDHRYYRSYSSRHCAPRYYSRGYCAPRYYSSGYCAPRYYYAPSYYSDYCAPRYYSSYGYDGYCAPRYYSGCYGGGIGFALPGIAIHFGHY